MSGGSGYGAMGLGSSGPSAGGHFASYQAGQPSGAVSGGDFASHA